MIEFGKTLRTAREAKGLTPGQIAERTHMIVQTVEGLEREDFSRIVAPIYGRGFVKLYCEAVGLEPQPLVDAFMEIYSSGRGTSAAKSTPTPAAPPEPTPAPVAETPSEPAKTDEEEPPPKVQTIIDFDAPAAPIATVPPTASTSMQSPQPSRYAAPMPIDDGFSMPAVNWRIVALGAAAVAIVVLAILGVTSKTENSAVAGIVIGLSLTLVPILGIAFTGTSVNPARSFGPALFVGGDALKNVWVFIVAPLVGGVLAALVYKFLSGSNEKK